MLVPTLLNGAPTNTPCKDDLPKAPLPVSSGPIILVYVGETGGFHASPVNNKYIWLREASPPHATHRCERRLQVAAPSTPGFSFGTLHCPGLEPCGLPVLSFIYNLPCSVQCCQVLPSSHPVFSCVALLSWKSYRVLCPHFVN